ncbi:hypothetical protein BKK79_01750 [Cupriavidus sp. USMAA2-4]|uniref:Uncharacterized protein n=1 Tax=Cupriavidus malaysiensis TaxID=367825 RepID=A0ABM6F927_9BURK|nr:MULTISPECIES: hypothetical protein [Cupriavidus]AOY93911.1 hypothetical protein BKK79_01750 [Cupriavidus sp. USMAA2-4]AOZ01272.1 hypothetical protein BKK81_10830 [Cupriavidus sp. USMAHM13]AOZ08095.1 hypothetical protein BKK80_11085 [Cupriavidus malaysiensis]
MEHLVRVQNEYDRQVLAWLRRRIGDAALAEAARRLGGERKPYLSSLCRALSIRPPARVDLRAEARRADLAVGERYLARIRTILGASGQASRAH